MTWLPGWVGPCVLLVVVPAVGANPPATIEFDAPAQAHGGLEVSGARWAMLVFSPEASAQADWSLQVEHMVNHSEVWQEIQRDGLADVSSWVASWDTPSDLVGSLDGRLGFGQAWASLYVEADWLMLQAAAADVAVVRSDGALGVDGYLPRERIEPGAYRLGVGDTSGVGFGLEAIDPEGLLAVSIQAHGLRRIEWHNAAATCSGARACQDGAQETRAGRDFDGEWSGLRFLPYLELLGSQGTLSASGQALVAASGGASPSATVDGWLRFPDADLQGSCGKQACPAPVGQTLQVQGKTTLEGIAPVDGTTDRVTAGFRASLESARLDETMAPGLARAAWAGAAVAGLAGVAVVWKALAALFARKARPVLDHPKAKAIHDLVLAHPGISFGGIEAETGWGHGTVQYHLRQLRDEGLVVAHGYRNTVRYFENHGRYEGDWREHAALRKPELRRLHEWIQACPDVAQGQVLAQTSKWGWPRSTTRHYLSLLLEARLLVATRTATSIAYRSLRPSASPRDSGDLIPA